MTTPLPVITGQARALALLPLRARVSNTQSYNPTPTLAPRLSLFRYICHTCACTCASASHSAPGLAFRNRARPLDPPPRASFTSPSRLSPPPPARRRFSTANNPPLAAAQAQAKVSRTNLPPRPKPPPEEELEEYFLKGSGPGGQKINKTNSAVQLKHIPTGIVIKCQATRSRSQNRSIARQLLADKLDEMNRGDESRAAVVGEFKRKKRASSAKKSRRKYRKLEEAKAAAAGEALGEEEEPHNSLYEVESSCKGDTDTKLGASGKEEDIANTKR
ncbi:RF-1 domain-containing protein [Xylariaceae sp. FL0594]|nr:RF-1 domain-containing protein [Xylariaceae sp. FL0594]